MRVIVIAGTSSGVGKTSVSVGVMRALRNRGLKVQAFKVGPGAKTCSIHLFGHAKPMQVIISSCMAPLTLNHQRQGDFCADFLDPMHHEEATGRPSVNLDGWMLQKEQNIASFHRAVAGADIAVVEGVMGLFDGHNGRTEVGSTAQMAKWLGAPVVLVLDCWALSRSAAAMIKGYELFDKDLLLGGVIFNRIGGDSHKHWLKEAVESSGLSVSVLGGIPKDERIAVKERYLGLHKPGEDDVPSDHAEQLGNLVEAHVDLDRLLELAERAEVPSVSQAEVRTVEGPKPRIAVAKDDAFCFYYTENLQLLREAGAEVVFFSPLHSSLPEDISGIYLGGGYPELHAADLSSRRDLRAAVKAFAEAGGVVYAECGGLLYLSQSIQPLSRMPSSMVGIFPFRTHMTEKSMKMGYVEVCTKDSCSLFPPEETVRGHVYHFSEILQEKVVGDFANKPPLKAGADGEGWDAGYTATLQVPGAQAVEEGFTWRNVLASYVHLHFGSNTKLATALVERCRQVDVAAVMSAVDEAFAESSGNSSVPPLLCVKAAKSSPNLQGLARQNSSIPRTLSVDLSKRSPMASAKSDAAAFDLEESFRRAAAARAMSMDASRVPGVDSWPVDGFASAEPGRSYAGTSGSGTPVDLSPGSTPTYTPPGPFDSRGGSAHLSPPALDHYSEYDDASRDGGSHASTSGRDSQDYPQPLMSSRSHSIGLLGSKSRPDLTRNEKIVSLVPSGTEILYALGLSNRIAGVTDLCSYPLEALDKPKASHTTIDTSVLSMEEVEACMQQCKAEGMSPFRIDEDFIARQQPGLILTQDSCQTCDPSTSQIYQALDRINGGEQGFHTEIIELSPRTIADIFNDIFEVADACGAITEAVRLVERLRTRLRTIASLVLKDSHRPRVLSLEGLTPFCSAGLWIPEMKELAGGECPLQEGGDQPVRISWDQVRDAEPDVLILSPCSFDTSRTLSELSNLAGLPGWWSLPAVKAGQVYIVNHEYFSKPGPRIVEGVQILARILHPEKVQQRAPENAVLKLSLRGGQRCRQKLIQNYFQPFY